MQFAIDENGVRTSINNSIKGKPYKCPCCDPYRRGEQIGEQYGYPVYEKKPAKKGFVRVLATYRECKTIVGNVYTEQEFEKYITSL